MARRDPTAYARENYVAVCWKCKAYRTTFVLDGRVCVRDDCRCERADYPDGLCPRCGVRGGHAHECATLAKPTS